MRSLVLAAPVNPWSTLGSGRIRFLNGRTGGALLRIVWPFSRPLYHTASGQDVWRSRAPAAWNSRRIPFAGDASGKGE